MKPYGTWNDIKPVAEVAYGLMRQGLKNDQIAYTLNQKHIPQHSGEWDHKKVSRLLQRAERKELVLSELFDPWAALDKLSWKALELPEVDYTDKGFNWTREELEEAAKLADHLVRYKAVGFRKSLFEDYIHYHEDKLGLTNTKEL